MLLLVACGWEEWVRAFRCALPASSRARRQLWLYVCLYVCLYMDMRVSLL
jgi:hypothetical protein